MENKSNEEKAKKKFDVLCKITAILIIACALLGFGTAIWVLCLKTIPKVMIVIIAVLFIACVIFNTLQISAKNKYINEIYKRNS